MSATRRVYIVWAVLLVLTLGSFLIGVEQDVGFASAGAVSILAIAVVKVRLIGVHFMDLRSAPTILRTLFDGYLAVLLTTLIALGILVRP